MSKDKVYLVPVNRLAPEFLLRIADQSVTADGDGCCGCEKPFGRAGRIAGAMIALNPGGGEKAAAITFLCQECGSRRAEVCRRLNVEPIESSPDDQKFWTHAVLVEMAIAKACSLDPADCVPGYDAAAEASTRMH
jgi:hypothetical protein